MSVNYYKFTLKPLPYDYSALEPFIDSETMHYHHDKHLQTYIDNLNKALAGYPKLQALSLQEILKRPKLLPKESSLAIMRNAGGVYNHNFFFDNLRPGNKNNRPEGRLANAINSAYGSFENFKKEFEKQALAVFGSGYLWLVKDKKGNLMLLPTANQESPITYVYTPLITIDVWEHAYYLKHQNRRVQYISDWWNVVNWDMANKNFSKPN